MLVLSLTGIWIPLVGFSPSSCLWFSIGAWFSINAKPLLQCSMLNVQCSIISSLSLLILDILTDGTPSDRYIHFAFLLVAVPTTYALFARLQRKSSPSFLIAGLSRDLRDCGSEAAMRGGVPFRAGAYDSFPFFLFAFHTLPLPFLGCRPVEWAKQLLWTDSHNGWLCIVQFIGAAVLTVAVCVLAYLLLQWLCPRFLYLLTGRKGQVRAD